jgi:hypothetical protein
VAQVQAGPHLVGTAIQVVAENGPVRVVRVCRSWRPFQDEE